MATTETPAIQRAASLVPLPALLDELGVRLADVLAGTRVSAEELRPDVFIPYAAYLEILDNAARITGHDDIGVLLGRRQTLSALGPLGRAMRHAATLGDALGEFAAFQVENSTGATVYLLRSDPDVIFGYGIYDPSIHISPHIHDMVLAVGCNLITELTRGAIEPQAMLSSRTAPADPTVYQALADCPIQVDQFQTCLMLAAESLKFELPEVNRRLHDAALDELAPELAAARANVGSQVARLLRQMLLVGRTRMVDVAARLDIHPRTLRRRLHLEGTTFETIKEEVRYAVARELLSLGTLSIIDIAITLDYASASSFIHAFRRWSGNSPTRWRENARRSAS